MARKRIQGPVRNKEKTKDRMLEAVGKILKNEGYTGLKVTNIAKTAEVDKKLIYDYYGSTDEVINTYIKSQDYWDNVSENSTEIIEENIVDNGKSLLKDFFERSACHDDNQYGTSKNHYLGTLQTKIILAFRVTCIRRTIDETCG